MAELEQLRAQVQAARDRIGGMGESRKVNDERLLGLIETLERGLSAKQQEIEQREATIAALQGEKSALELEMDALETENGELKTLLGSLLNVIDESGGDPVASALDALGKRLASSPAAAEAIATAALPEPAAPEAPAGEDAPAVDFAAETPLDSLAEKTSVDPVEDAFELEEEPVSFEEPDTELSEIDESGPGASPAPTAEAEAALDSAPAEVDITEADDLEADDLEMELAGPEMADSDMVEDVALDDEPLETEAAEAAPALEETAPDANPEAETATGMASLDAPCSPAMAEVIAAADAANDAAEAKTESAGIDESGGDEETLDDAAVLQRIGAEVTALAGAEPPAESLAPAAQDDDDLEIEALDIGDMDDAETSLAAEAAPETTAPVTAPAAAAEQSAAESGALTSAEIETLLQDTIAGKAPSGRLAGRPSTVKKIIERVSALAEEMVENDPDALIKAAAALGRDDDVDEQPKAASGN